MVDFEPQALHWLVLSLGLEAWRRSHEPWLMGGAPAQLIRVLAPAFRDQSNPRHVLFCPLKVLHLMS
jgi:hypothetical protein